MTRKDLQDEDLSSFIGGVEVNVADLAKQYANIDFNGIKSLLQPYVGRLQDAGKTAAANCLSSVLGTNIADTDKVDEYVGYLNDVKSILNPQIYSMDGMIGSLIDTVISQMQASKQ